MNVLISEGGWGGRNAGNVLLSESNDFLSFGDTENPASDTSSLLDPIQLYGGGEISSAFSKKEQNVFNASLNEPQPVQINAEHARLYKRHLEIDAMPKTKTRVECAVCLSSDANCAISNCGHQFHSSCAIQWLRAHGSCPVCRVVVVDLEPVAPGSTDVFEQAENDEFGDVSNFMDMVFEVKNDYASDLLEDLDEDCGLFDLPTVTLTEPVIPGQSVVSTISGTSPCPSPSLSGQAMYPDNIGAQNLSAPAPQPHYGPMCGPPSWRASAYPEHLMHRGPNHWPSQGVEHASSLCSVCFKVGVDVVVNPCNHVYHGQCVKPLLEASVGDCPLCQVPIMGFAPIQAAADAAVGGYHNAVPVHAPQHHSVRMMPSRHYSHGYSHGHMHPHAAIGHTGMSPMLADMSMTASAWPGAMPPPHQLPHVHPHGSYVHPHQHPHSMPHGLMPVVGTPPLSDAAACMTLLDRKRKHDLVLAARGKRSREAAARDVSCCGTASSTPSSPGADTSSSAGSSPGPIEIDLCGEGESSAVTAEDSCCTCSNGCRNTRCACVKNGGVCGPKCRCADCRNPFKAMEEAGIDLEAVRAFADDCMMQNLSKVKSMPNKLKTIVTMGCCKVKVPLSQAVTGIDCPKCGEHYLYSWCWGKLCSVKTLPRNHCKTCKHCGDHRNVHCMHCGMCYFAGVGSGQSCTCKDSNLAGRPAPVPVMMMMPVQQVYERAAVAPQLFSAVPPRIAHHVAVPSAVYSPEVKQEVKREPVRLNESVEVKQAVDRDCQVQ